MAPGSGGDTIASGGCHPRAPLSGGGFKKVLLGMDEMDGKGCRDPIAAAESCSSLVTPPSRPCAPSPGCWHFPRLRYHPPSSRVPTVGTPSPLRSPRGVTSPYPEARAVGGGGGTRQVLGSPTEPSPAPGVPAPGWRCHGRVSQLPRPHHAPRGGISFSRNGAGPEHPFSMVSGCL